MKAVKRSNSHQPQSRSTTVQAPGTIVPRRVAPKASLPTTLEIRGIPIHFPFKPYKCQEDYMRKVLDALLDSENALLESPTGTGKVSRAPLTRDLTQCTWTVVVISHDEIALQDPLFVVRHVGLATAKGHAAEFRRLYDDNFR